MSYARKLDDARKHHASAVIDADEAHCYANQTGRAADGQRYFELLRDAEEAAEDVAVAETGVVQ